MKENVPFRFGAAGWSVRRNLRPEDFAKLTTPSAAASCGSRLSFDAATSVIDCRSHPLSARRGMMTESSLLDFKLPPFPMRQVR